ncbi:MAG: Allantoicase [Thelocarpon superellum]|nr:MAG: Allantoicase [Thelocarpon superellum]
MDTQALSPETIQDIVHENSPASSIRSIPPAAIDETFNLASASLSSTIVSTSDEFFAPASSLLSPLAPIQKSNTYVPTGAWYDGWETRRHNPDPPDWVIVQLGVGAGHVVGFEVDTAFFAGNHAEKVAVQGARAALGAAPGQLHWEPILPPQPCGPSARHAWLLAQPTGTAYTHLRLQMFPDGGIARFRAYGRASPIFPADSSTAIDLAAARNGARAVAWSNQRFGRASNLLLPGRGHDMGDGWETSRSRGAGHEDWVIVKLGAPAAGISSVVVDTAFFRGNFPQSVRVEALDFRKSPSFSSFLDQPRRQEEEEHVPAADDPRWHVLVPSAPCGADREHLFDFTTAPSSAEPEKRVASQVTTHVKLVMVPDGGVKRLRVFGRRNT